MKSSYVYIGLVVVIIVGLVLIRNGSNASRENLSITQYDSFAQCIADAGAKFYGAYWCPHCQEQEELFDNSKYLPYIECSTPNGQNQTKTCVDAGITGYPTWIFADGSIANGLQSFEELAGKTNCELPVAQ
ncbi:MAG: hypothetical protein K9M10_01030 [Candidatus Pacebacteria bacterium]|nr:hypothetical protein [Candidatus Paceibacterota bacterium]MCF7857046.1 hypothetical protein [Candidatus Paceibacterota bacterium]